jgi:probable HAF family extracellular repeat protein
VIRVVALAMAAASVVDLGGAVGSVRDLAGDRAVGTIDGRAFVREGGATRTLPGLPDRPETGANAVNASGAVVGYAMRSDATGMRAVRWVDGTATDLGTLGGDASGATDIDASGTVVGWSMTSGQTEHGFRWSAGRLEDLDAVLPKPAGAVIRTASAIDDRGRIAGSMVLANGEMVGYLSDGATTTEVRLAPGDSVIVSDLGPDGTVVGRSNDRAFSWRDGAATELPPLPGHVCSEALALDGGDIVGWSSPCGRGRSLGVVWRDGVPTAAQVLLPAGSGDSVGVLHAIGGGQAGGSVDTSTGSPASLLDLTPEVQRLGNDDPVATSIAVQSTYAPQVAVPGGAVLAAADAPADLAVAAAFAARLGLPLLLTGRSSLDPRVADVIAQRISGSTIYVVGGTGVLSRSIDDALAWMGRRAQRVAGPDRYATADVAVFLTGATGKLAVDAEDTTTALTAVPRATFERLGIVFTGPGRPAPPEARVLTPIDRGDSLVATPLAPVTVRFGRIPDAAVGATLAAQGGSPLRLATSAGLPTSGYVVGDQAS